jgi:deoxyribodipyrimidine photo-lyase
MTPVVLWLRRDLRLGDHPALTAAARIGPVLPLFVCDPSLLEPAGTPRVAMLARTLSALDADLRRCGGRLVVRRGQPEAVVPAVVHELGAGAVHISADFGPYGAARDRRVAEALGRVPLVATGSPYAVSPGRLQTTTGEPYRVYSAFARAWRAHGWPAPAPSDPKAVSWAALRTDGVPDEPCLPEGLRLPEVGEEAAGTAWRRFTAGALVGYAGDRDRPDLEATSRLSVHLKWGTIHPRTLLAELARTEDRTTDDVRRSVARFRDELAWREFYAAVLAAWPDSARKPFQPRLATIHWDDDPGHFAYWAEGRTGYPLVDAGMRQLLVEGWMHNRVRMVTASFLAKDLHQDWRRGARHFMAHLADGDLASNQHGWQWTAGTGADAAPYHRILNPVTQARRFDPDGTYVRRFVPELRGLGTPEIFEPWRRPGGPPAGYLAPIVDHATERQRALTRYEERARPKARGSGRSRRQSSARGVGGAAALADPWRSRP